jgi:transposase
MKPTSIDLRLRIVKAVNEEGTSRREAAERLMVCPSTAIKILQLFEATGGVTPGKMGGHRKAFLAPHKAVIAAIVEERPDATLEELAATIDERIGLSVSASTVDKALKRFGFRFKKKASSRRSRPARTSPCAAATTGGSSNDT